MGSDFSIGHNKISKDQPIWRSTLALPTLSSSNSIKYIGETDTSLKYFLINLDFNMKDLDMKLSLYSF